MRLILLSLLAGLFSPVSHQDPPDKSLPVAPAGWRVELVAKPPALEHPSVVTCAPDGRIFVGEDPMDMRGPSNKPIDRILCIRPGGKTTVFADGLYAVYGLLYLDGKLYVHHTPKLSVFRDDDGVGKDRVDLFECTNPDPSLNGTGFNDHIPSNIRFAMDGYIYLSTGDKGLFGMIDREGARVDLRGGGLVRFRPDGTKLEIYSTGTRNHLDVALDPEDEMFTYDNTDDGMGWWTRLTHMVDGGYYGYPWDYKPQQRHTLWMMKEFGGGSGTGAMCYTEDGLPDEYRGNLFFCDWARSEIVRIRVARDGGTFKTVTTTKFLTRGTEEFRPVGIALIPDGSGFYVTDWNFNGWTQKVKAGRLLKVTFEKSAAAPKPDWTSATTADLVAGLRHSSRAVRLAAQRRLIERKDGIAAVTAVLTNPKEPAHARWHAIWTLDGLDAGRDAILAALVDADLSVRRQAARQLGTRRSREAVKPLLKMVLDGDPSIRFAAATALGRIGDSAAVPRLLEALDQVDLFARYAAFTALNRIGRRDPTAWRAIAAGLESENKAIAEGAGFAMRETYDEALVKVLVELASSSSSSTRISAIIALAPLHRKAPAWDGKWWSIQPVRIPPPGKTVEWAGTATVVATLRKALDDESPVVRVAAIISLKLARETSVAGPLRALFAREAEAGVKKQILWALGDFKDPGAVKLVAELLRDRPADLLAPAVDAAISIGGTELTDALIALIDADVEPAVLIKTIDAMKSPAAIPALTKRLRQENDTVSAAAAKALGRIGAPAAEALIAALDDKRPIVRRRAVAALGPLKIKSALPALLAAYIDGETRFEAIGALAEMPDVRALDAYLEGIAGKNQPLREKCRAAVRDIRDAAMPLIEKKLKAQELAPEIIAELQAACAAHQPILEWRVLGPFPNPVDDPFKPGEIALDAEYKGVDGKPVRWTTKKAGGAFGHLDLVKHVTAQPNVVAYAYAEVTAAADHPVEFLIGSDDGVTVWLNGEKAFEDLGDRGWAHDQFRVKKKLKAGRNAILVKVGQHGGDWGLSVALSRTMTGPLFEAKVKKLDAEAYAKFARENKGDVASGRKLVQDRKSLPCLTCHIIEGEGADVGPNLAGIAAKYGREDLVESLLYPSKRILDGYKQWLIVTTDGDVINGIIRAETADEVTFVDAAGERRFKKSAIKSRRESAMSLMPSELNGGLSLQEFADVIAYLESMK